MVLCIQYLVEDTVIGGEKVPVVNFLLPMHSADPNSTLTSVPFQLSKQAVKDYNRGRVYLSDLANRDGIPVFDDIQDAVRCAISKVGGQS